MNKRRALPVALRCLGAALGMLALGAGAHTLPISYLHFIPDADYLHLELVFNPFELTFMSEVDENKDGELSPAELQAHGQMVADRLANCRNQRTQVRLLVVARNDKAELRSASIHFR